MPLRVAPDGNPDKQIRTHFYTLGGEVMLNRSWSLMAEAPVWNRTFRTDGDDGLTTARHTAFGDVRLQAVYTGLSRDRSTGLILGVKLPAESHSLAGFDRDTQIGTGSTDLLIGGYHRGAFDVGQKWGWFVQGAGELPIASQGDYKPGGEVNAAAGVVYAGVSLAGGRLMLTPVMQLITSVRGKDSGAASDPNNIGYRRLILAPGLQINGRKWKVYGDVEIPLAQSFNGRQLASPAQFKVILSRDF